MKPVTVVVLGSITVTVIISVIFFYMGSIEGISAISILYLLFALLSKTEKFMKILSKLYVGNDKNKNFLGVVAGLVSFVTAAVVYNILG